MNELRDYYQNGKKIGEFKRKNNLYLCYVPTKKSCVKHQTLETLKEMKAFFQKQR